MDTVTDPDDLNLDFNMMGSDLEEEMTPEVEFVSQREEDISSTVLTFTSEHGIDSSMDSLRKVDEILLANFKLFTDLSWDASEPNKIEVILMGTRPASESEIKKIAKAIQPLAKAKSNDESDSDPDDHEPEDSNELTESQIENFQSLGYNIDQWSADEEIRTVCDDIVADKEMAYRA